MRSWFFIITYLLIAESRRIVVKGDRIFFRSQTWC